jgi:ketosteroid isomerase-like protein
MSETDIDVILAEYEAMCRGDWPDVFSRANPDFEFQPPSGGIGGGVIQGRERSRRDIEEFFSPYEEVILEPEEFHERGDCIAVVLRMRTRPRGSTATVETRLGNLWVMRDGKPARLEIHPEPEAALRAAERALEPARPWE